VDGEKTMLKRNEELYIEAGLIKQLARDELRLRSLEVHPFLIRRISADGVSSITT